MDSTSWQFLIDVGGTFTDCIAQNPNGSGESSRRHKLLSSAITPGVIESAKGRLIQDTRRNDDVDAFWNGATFRIADLQCDFAFESPIIKTQNGTLELQRPIPSEGIGLRYEIHTPLEAPVIGIHHLLQVPLNQPLPPVSLRLGTTRGTNALLTRSGARTLFVTTEGFGDILRIGNQDRPELFTLNIEKPAPLFESVLEVNERIDTHGKILKSLESESIRKALIKAKALGFESVAICLMNAFVCDKHEVSIEHLAKEVGFEDVSRSSLISPLIKLVSRADTTVVNSYLNPVLTKYIHDITRQLHAESSIRLLTSAGGLVEAESFCGRDSILSGPAGGVIGFSSVAKQAGFAKAIGFDMGGTSTDVSRFDGEFEYEYETQKAGARIVTPMLAIETVAAGGGSICRFDGIKLTVGPQSAGSVPGPACYGAGGPLTVTDLNLVLGRILPDQFSIPLDHAAANNRLKELCKQIEETTGYIYRIHDLAEAFLSIANHNMSQAIGNISVAKGYDPADYVLVNFGGAAAQHACGVANLLNISTILNHPDAGILSAYGMGQASVKRQGDLGIYKELDQELFVNLAEQVYQTTNTLQRQIIREGYTPTDISIRIVAEIRPRGVNATLQIPIIESPVMSFVWKVDAAAITSMFQVSHLQRYGFEHSQPLELVTLRIEATGDSGTPASHSTEPPTHECTSTVTTSVFHNGRWYEAQRFQRSELSSGTLIAGPAIVTEQISTTFIEPGWQGIVLSNFEILLNLVSSSQNILPVQKDPSNPAMLEIFNNYFVSVANQMGLTLQNTSSSVNVKERLDFSCAIFTAEGELVVNAPHIPVHLGAMGESVRAILQDHDLIAPGDVFITNDPYRGGSHLPDITVITPVFNSDGERIFFTASRAHHSEIGGCTPGSMPPFSKTLAEEGILIRSQKIVEAGISREAELRSLLTTGEFPSRSAKTNMTDIHAQVAANRQGANDLNQMMENHGESTVLAYMKLIQDAAAKKTRQALLAIPDGIYEYQDYLDEHFTEDYEAKIHVTIQIDGDTAKLDFTGTSPVLPINLNANRAIVTAAVLYVLRLLIDEPIPLNQGVLEPVTLVLPDCFLNPTPGLTAADSPAVVGGNVETSQRIVDVLIGALQLAAASQGTMNNLLFGDKSFGYYETICGGAGATSEAAGADAVHTHMTNTRITDPEILERRYPVRLEQFRIRTGSGGKGKYRGGNGIIRQMTFLKPVTVSLLTQRRNENHPAGLAEGGAGQSGVNKVLFADGREELLKNRQQFAVNVGDQLTIETPGGGGWGNVNG